MNILELRKAMRACAQTPTQNVLEHGMSVAHYFNDLRHHVLNNTPLKYEWRMPEWASDPLLWNNILDLKTIATYQIYHDCGKPFCRVEDEKGHHFPNHAQVSADTWMEITGNEQQSKLMLMDMDLHIMKSGEQKEFATRKEAATLLLTSLCEIHSNAAMFGGIESTSFKIKWKKLNRFGKQILNHMKENTL